MIGEPRLLEHEQKAAVIAYAQVIMTAAAEDADQTLHKAMDRDQDVTNATVQQDSPDETQGSRHVLTDACASGRRR